MRTIKFRGKPLYSDEAWIFGGYALAHGVEDEHQIIVPVGDRWQTKAYAVDPATIGQFTGLTDKDGRGIYEGDIFHAGDKTILYVVEWLDCGLIGRQIPNRSRIGIEHWRANIEVIGNIHDNKKLLKHKS